MAPLATTAHCSSLQHLLEKTKKKSDFQRVQCVLLRKKFGMNAATVAQITGFKPSTVRKIWSQYRKEGEDALMCKNRGGRRNCHLTKEEERLFLAPYFKKAENTKSLQVSEIQDSYERLIGKKVPKSTIYRMLSRHGWRRSPGTTYSGEAKRKKEPGMHEYWIEGCSQVLHPERTGNISQQWLNTTLLSMAGKEKND